MPEDRGKATGLPIRYIEPGDGDRRHGTSNGYTNLHCRCQPCRDAWATEVRARHAKRKGSLAPDDRRHGTYNGYRNYGCRCPSCKAARYEYEQSKIERTKAAR